MGKELIIRNEEAIALAEQLAAAHGESLEAAVLRALQSVGARDSAGRLARLKTFQANIATLPGPPPRSNHDWLYDEHGLPT